MNAIFYVTLIICGSVLLGILLALPIRKQLEQLQRYWNVEIGMPEEEMLDIMGEGYNRSFLKNNRVKYECALTPQVLALHIKVQVLGVILV